MSSINVDTTKNILKMMYDGKIKSITDKCLLLPDNSLFNLDTNEIITLDENTLRVEGYANNKFIYARHRGYVAVYNVNGKLILTMQSIVKPRVEAISGCEYILITKRFVYVYNSNIEAITKQIKYTNIFIDMTRHKVDIAYLEDDNLRVITLDIKL